MVKTPRGLRLHIGVFGRRNTGKSSILNALVGQEISIVSDVAGTTTDPVEKVMELKPIGPVVFIDTAGIDDTGYLGQARIRQTEKVVARTELALLVTDRWSDYEKQLLEIFAQTQTPVVVAANKSDLRDQPDLEQTITEAGAGFVTSTCALTGGGMDLLRQQIIEATPIEFLESAPVIADLVAPGDRVLLVTPIDLEAPKGRLKMLQVHCLREILDRNALVMVVKETELADALESFRTLPTLIVSDSQVFDKVTQIVPPNVKMTSFSILMARLKGDFQQLLDGAGALASLVPGDKVLIAEACTHHPVGEDIGRVQIPRLLETLAGGPIEVEVSAGRDYPEDLSPYKVIVHCGSCVFNKKEMLSRIETARCASVPITNYGMAITLAQGLLERALEPFGLSLNLGRDAKKLVADN